jgi:hypothetical protein
MENEQDFSLRIQQKNLNFPTSELIMNLDLHNITVTLLLCLLTSSIQYPSTHAPAPLSSKSLKLPHQEFLYFSDFECSLLQLKMPWRTVTI